MKAFDPQHAVEIAPRVWWVGHCLEGDPFQCHVYLIEQGEQSVLIDPGSQLTFAHTRKKIEEIIPFSHIRYFICHHQDPDITGAMPNIDAMALHEQAVLVTHWRAKMLLRHYALKIPFWLVDEHDWMLSLEDRTLRFALTPYAHFPGAFITYDEQSKTLFSSDLFGGLTKDFSLFAKDESYLEAMKPFHQHYMPSNDVLNYAMGVVERFPYAMIAPQHGSILRQPLADTAVRYLKSLDCGLYMLLGEESDIMRLSRFNDTLRQITQTMILHRDFKDIAQTLQNIISEAMTIVELSFFVLDSLGKVLCFSQRQHYRGVEVEPSESIMRMLRHSSDIHQDYVLVKSKDSAEHYHALVPLSSAASSEVDNQVQAIAHIDLGDHQPEKKRFSRLLEQMRLPLQVAIEREMIYREIDRKRQEIYYRAIHDPLTGLFTRVYMQDIMRTLLEQQNRNKHGDLSAVMMDIDHFKRINDTFGHPQGDIVLQRVAQCLLSCCRSGDIPVRLGGEEFIVFCTGTASHNNNRFAERLRLAIAEMSWQAPMENETITASFGVALRQIYESLDDLIARTDQALYEAKNSGRNRVIVAMN